MRNPCHTLLHTLVGVNIMQLKWPAAAPTYSPQRSSPFYYHFGGASTALAAVCERNRENILMMINHGWAMASPSHRDAR